MGGGSPWEDPSGLAAAAAAPCEPGAGVRGVLGGGALLPQVRKEPVVLLGSCPERQAQPLA